MKRITKKCPFCGEEILAEAKKCKYCGEWLMVDENKTQSLKRNKVLSFVSKHWYLVVIMIGLSVGRLSKCNTEPNDKLIFDSLLRNDSVDFSFDKLKLVDKPKLVVDHDIEDVRNIFASSKYTKYTNTRFGFSIKYPNCFVKGEEPENGDGCGFSMKYSITFSVSGSYNVNDENIQQYYKNDTDLPLSTYQVKKSNWYVISGKTNDGRIFYKKVVLMSSDIEGGTFVTFYLLFPEKFKTVMTDFINYEAKNFNPKYEGTFIRQQEDVELIDPLENLQIEVQEQPNIE